MSSANASARPAAGANTLTEIEDLAAIGEGERKGYDVVQDHWEGQLGSAEFEKRWNRALQDGVVADTAFEPKTVKVVPGDWTKPGERAAAGGLEIALRTDPSVFDGRFANLGWLQELPKPFTKLTWDNTIQLGPATAKRLGVANEDVVELKAGAGRVQGPAWVVLGQAEDTVTVHFGYGRTKKIINLF